MGYFQNLAVFINGISFKLLVVAMNNSSNNSHRINGGFVLDLFGPLPHDVT
jgi:hypothetical protein